MTSARMADVSAEMVAPKQRWPDVLYRTQSVSIDGVQSTRLLLTCSVPQGSVLGPVLFLVYCADVIAIAGRHGLEVHSYADDTQLYFHADPSAVDNKVQKLVTCVGDIGQWMCANRLKLNQDKTQFIWLGTPHQLSKLQLQTITLGGVDIMISTEAMCPGVLLDSPLTFAPDVRRLCGKSFYHLRQMNTGRKSLTEDAATTMVHAFVTSRVHYCNSVLHRASAASVQPLQNVLNAAVRIILRKRKFDHSTTDVRDQLHWLPVQQRIEYKVCVLVYKSLHQASPAMHTSLNCAHRSLNQPIVVSFVQLFGVTWQFLAPEQWDTVKDVLLFLVQHFLIHSHCLFVIHRCHGLSSVRVWRLCYSAEHTEHQHSAYMTV